MFNLLFKNRREGQVLETVRIRIKGIDVQGLRGDDQEGAADEETV